MQLKVINGCNNNKKGENKKLKPTCKSLCNCNNIGGEGGGIGGGDI